MISWNSYSSLPWFPLVLGVLHPSQLSSNYQLNSLSAAYILPRVHRNTHTHIMHPHILLSSRPSHCIFARLEKHKTVGARSQRDATHRQSSEYMFEYNDNNVDRVK
jgi:hypothetical protein